MSDIFDDLDPRRLPYRPSGNGAEARRQGVDSLTAEARQRNLRARAFKEAYSLNLPIEQYGVIADAVDSGILGEDQVYNILTSRFLSLQLKKEGVDFEPGYILENMDAFREYYLGKTGREYTPKTMFAAIKGKLAIGAHNVQRGVLGNQLAGALLSGDVEREKNIRERLALLQEEDGFLNDYQDRPWYQEAVLAFSESSPYTGFLLASGAVGGPAGAFASGAALARGQTFLGLDAAGVKPELANGLSLAAGAVNGAIEMFLGDVPSGLTRIARIGGKPVAEIMSRRLSKLVAGGVAKKLHVSAFWLNQALRFASEQITRPVEEMLEEGAQEAVDIAVLEMAGILQKEGVEIEDRDYLRRVGEAMRLGYLSSLVFGLGDVVMGPASSAAEMRRVKALAAVTPGLEAFKKEVGDSDLFKGLPDETKRESIEKIHGTVRKRIGNAEKAEKAETAAGEKPRPAALPTAESPGPAPREENGDLYTKITDRQTLADGYEEARLSVGDPRTGAYLGGITYRQDDDTIIIDSVDAADYLTDRDAVIHDAVLDLAGQNRGMNIEWDPADPALMEIKDRLVDENPRGPDAGLQWFDAAGDVSETRQAAPLRNALRRTFFRNASEKQVQAAAALVYAIDRRLGFNAGAALNNDVFIYTREELLADPAMAEILRKNRALGTGVAGGTFFIRDGEAVSINTASKEFGQGIRAVMFAAENADFSTFAHEFFHFVDTAYIGRNRGMRQLFERALNKKYDDFTRTDREFLARSFEKYLREGRAPDGELQGLFQKIAQAMITAFNAIKNTVTLSPLLREAFDALLTDTDSQAYRDWMQARREAELARVEDSALAAQGPPDSPGGEDEYDMDSGVLFSRSDEILEERDIEHDPTAELIRRAADMADPGERARAVGEIRALRDRYAGTEAEFRAPNGKPSLLLESLGEEKGRQAWYAVRTPSFRDWFGDWERAARIAELEKSPNLKLDGNAYKGKYDLNKESMLEYLNNLRKETDRNPLHNNSLPDNIKLSARGIKKIIGYGLNQDVYKKILAHIPEITRQAVFIADQKPNKPTAPYKLYRHLASGIEIDGKPSTVHIILGENSGTWYYDHIITEIEKGRLLAGIQVTTPGHPKTSLPDIKDTTLIGILQAPNASKVVDANGEPLAVFHGTEKNGFSVFYTGERTGNSGRKQSGAFFSAEKDYAKSYGENLTAAFLDIKNPLITTEYSDISRLNDDRINSLGEKYDGVVFNDMADGTPYAPKEDSLFLEIAVFSPTQIKSATDNAGTYGNENPSVLFQSVGEDVQKIRADARMPRDAESLTEAENIVKNKETGFLNRPITNRLFNITATVSGKSLGEMTNEKQVRKAVSPRLQAKAVANADVLFERAIIHKTHKDIHGRKEVEQVHRFGALMEDGDNFIPVKITVIEYKSDDYGNRIYAIEAVDAENMKSAGLMPQPGTNPENSGPIADFNNSLAALVDYVKPAGEDILYQFAEEEILARARPFDSWPEWRDYEEKQNELNGIDADFGLETESVTPEGLSGAEADAWYRAKWEKAQGIKRDAAGKEIREAGELSTEEIDVMFLDRMEEGGALERFLEETWYTINPENIFGGVNTGEEDAAREEAEELARRVRNEMHPTVVNNARRVAAGKPLTGSARKAILTLMEKGARHYRALYTEITGDQEFAALAAREVKTKPDIRDPEGRPLSIVQKEQIARKIKNEEIQKKFLSGELVPEEVQSYVEDLRKEKRELQRRLEKAEEEIADDLQYLNRAERNAVRREKELSAAENTIRNYEREIERLEKDLARVRARRRLERQAAEEKNGARKKKESQKRADAAGQARERREKLENSYIRRLDKTRAMLREKRTRLEELEKEYGDFVRSARAQATMQKYVAVNRLKEQIREKIAERRAALKIIADKRRLVNDIMREPSKGIWYEHREKIRAIQRVIDPKVRRAKVIWKGEMYDINVFRDRAIAEGLAGILPKNLVTRVFRKSINEWTVGELEEMRDQVERLRLEGRYEWNRRELERKMGIDAAQRAAVNQNNMNPEYRHALAAGSKERKKQLEKLDTLFRKIGAGTWTLSRIAQWADGHAKGAHYKNLVTEERQVYAVKMDNMDRRYKRIFDFMKKIGKEIRDLYNREYTIRGIGPGNSDATFTVSDLMFMFIGLRDRNTRAAIIYGNMMNNDERNHTDATVLRKAGAEKMRILHDFVNRTLSAKEKALAEEIGNDFRDEFGRLNDIFANEFNRVMTRVNSYVPMITQDATASGNRHEKQQGNEILNVAGVSISRTPEKGFAVKRVKIGPRNQRAIRLDLFGTWMKAVERQEHFAAYNRYIRKLNAVYKGNSSTSRFLQEQIGQIYGPELLNRIKTEINALANPQSFKDERNIDLIIKVIRGNTAAAYLAFNVPSVLKQFAASPLPYMAHVNPVQYAASALRFLSNPVEFSRGIKEKSAIMRHRQANPAFGVLRQLQENSKGKRGLAAFQSAGMKGLEIADWVSVAVGWDAVYEKALAEGLSEQEAVARADDVTLQTQPSSREQDLPPLYKNQPEAMKIITQFTTSLNPIWNQFTYDLPVAVKNRQFGHAVSMLVAYGLAGWGIGAVTSLFSKDDDDDDEDTKRRRFLYWSFSQALDSVPLLGNGVSALAEQLITGQRRRQFTSPVFPAGQKLLDAASRAGAGDWDRAAQNLAEGIGIGIGAPVSATKQVFRIIRKE